MTTIYGFFMEFEGTEGSGDISILYHENWKFCASNKDVGSILILLSI